MGRLFQGNETESGDYSSTVIGSLKLVSIFCAKRISTNESKKARVDSAPWFRLTRSTCNTSWQPPVSVGTISNPSSVPPMPRSNPRCTQLLTVQCHETTVTCHRD